MRICVIGAGIVGVATAYELGIDGHAVTVLERNGAVALEGSFSDSGLIAAAMAWPAPAPSWTRRWLRRMPVAWPDDVPAPGAALRRLSMLSQQRLRSLAAEHNLDWESADGCLLLLRDAHEVSDWSPRLTALAAESIAARLVDAAEAVRIEPGLQAADGLAAAVYSPDAGVGNCRQVAHLLRTEAVRHGVVFLFQHTVDRIFSEASPRVSASTAGGQYEEAFDAVVVCAGNGSAQLLDPLGVRLPWRRIAASAVTAQIAHDDGRPETSPRAAVIDAQTGIAITRIGFRVRASSAVEGRRSVRQQDASVAQLYRVWEHWFPGAARGTGTQRWHVEWMGLSDGAPAVGPSAAAGVWLNTGHGRSAWSAACAAARGLADMLAGRAAEAAFEACSAARWRAP